MAPKYNGKPVILHGRAHPVFAESLATQLGWSHVPVEVATFSDGEVHAAIHENVEGADVYIVQPTSFPANDHLMELLFIADAAKHMKAKRITAVIPFFGYRRQEKRTVDGESLSFDVIAKILAAGGIQRVLVMDLHKHRSLHYFASAGVQHNELRAFPQFVEYFKEKPRHNLVILAPDKGRVPEATEYATALGIPLIIATKHRYVDQKDRAFFDELEADVNGKDVIIIDDEVNTAGTLLGVTQMMKDQGAREIYVACTHAVLSGPAIERLSKAPITEFIITDTIALPEEKNLPIFQTISVIPVFAEALREWAAA